MSNARRLVIVVAALALAIAAFFVFRPEDTTQRDDPVRTEAPRNGGTERGPADAGGGTPGDDDSTDERPPAESAFEEIRIADGEPVGKARTVSVESGGTVRLAFRSDAAGEVHIHGYDRYVDVKAGGTVRTRFPAELEGIFEVEDHGSGALLAKLRVEP
ncbi:MAG: hypothetical protein H0V55_03725 [Thermoleophilaceae bacterium]|jgi:hypothetical protein|nr:hypothetical protein [Thermoleophilaceae bacterium]